MLLKILSKYIMKGEKPFFLLSQNFKIIGYNIFITGKHPFISEKQGAVTAST